MRILFAIERILYCICPLFLRQWWQVAVELRSVHTPMSPAHRGANICLNFMVMLVAVGVISKAVYTVLVHTGSTGTYCNARFDFLTICFSLDECVFVKGVGLVFILCIAN